MRVRRGIWLFIIFFLASAASFNGFYSERHFHEAGVPLGLFAVGFDAMVDGSADRPYVYRQLLPTTANWADKVTPHSIKEWLYSKQTKGDASWFIALTTSPSAMNEKYFFRYLWVYLATFLFALTGTYAMYLVCRAMDMSLPISVLAPIVVILLLPYFMNSTGFFYDYVELAFLALAVWITATYRWWWAIPIAALGAWNKESFLFIIPTLYPFMQRRNSRFASMAGVGILSLICGSVYLAIRVRFAQNPGSTVVFQLFDQFQYLSSHVRMDIFSGQELYGIRVPAMYSLIPMTLLVWAVCGSWRSLPAVIQKHAQIAAAINIPLFLLFGTPGEMRNLSMLYIALLCVIAVNLDQSVNGLN